MKDYIVRATAGDGQIRAFAATTGNLVEEARKRLAEILDINEPTEFFKTVDKKRDDLLDDAEDTAPVFDFFKGDQRKIFEEAVKNLAYFGNNSAGSKYFFRSPLTSSSAGGIVLPTYRISSIIKNDHRPLPHGKEALLCPAFIPLPISSSATLPCWS